jgi:hypothetical protein
MLRNKEGTRVKLEVNEEHPLRWPDGQARTRIQDRKTQGSWKKKAHEYQALLIAELKKIGATSVLITTNKFPDSERDPGVAVYFSMKQEDYSWQEALGFIGTLPTVDQIQVSYREKAKRVHPDGPTPDAELFHAITKHRDSAVAYVTGKHLAEHEKVMAVDAFKEVRLNMAAIRLALSAIRQIERCGAPILMERAFRGFNKMISAGAAHE